MGSNDTLSRILADTRERLNKAKKTTSIAQMQSELGAAPSLRGFQSRLHAQAAKGKTALICELKKASPSRGLIRADFDPAQLAQAYQQGGACCLSVLTDAPWFQGCNADLQAARAASNLPVLRKDFMIDPWQILESRLLGADCVLLIMAALARNQAIELEQTALEAGMDVLIEVHDAKELDAAQSWLQSAMIGINSRDLRTLKVSLAATESLLPKIGSKHLAIAESGIEHPDDIERLAAAGARAFLVGSSLMKAGNLAQATRTLAGGHL